MGGQRTLPTLPQVGGVDGVGMSVVIKWIQHVFRQLKVVTRCYMGSVVTCHDLNLDNLHILSDELAG